MPVIAVINRKGGSGKSTLATHLAAFLARRGLPVMLGDVDRQQSTVYWLKRRAEQPGLPGAPIVGWALDPRNTLRPPPGVAHVVLDTPGGLQGFELARLLSHADAVLMPVGESAFDRESAAACHAELRASARVAGGRCQLAAVGMRIDARTHGAGGLQRWAAERELPLLTVLRSAQVYVRCAERGLSVFDLPPERVRADLRQWQPVIEWLGPIVEPPRDPRIARAEEALEARISRPIDLAPAVPREPSPGPRRVHRRVAPIVADPLAGLEVSPPPGHWLRQVLRRWMPA